MTKETKTGSPEKDCEARLFGKRSGNGENGRVDERQAVQSQSLPRRERDFKVLAEVISPDNVQVMAELIAIKETKHLIGYMGYPAEKALKKLCCDVHHIGEANYSVSDSYDLVQAVALFLCEHFGERLDDYCYSKNGKITAMNLQ